MNQTGKFARTVLLLILIGVSGCQDSRLPFVGTYRTSESIAGKGQIELILKDNGECTWTLEQSGQTLKFKWRVAEGRVLLYTKEGGILVLIPSPDRRTLAADLTGEWQPGCLPNHCLTFIRQEANP